MRLAQVTPGQYMVVAKNGAGTAASQAGVRLRRPAHAPSSREASLDSQPSFVEEHFQVPFLSPLIVSESLNVPCQDEIESLSGLEQRPPRIVKGIRSYRVRPSDKITLFMEVGAPSPCFLSCTSWSRLPQIDSTHPVIFRWFYEDLEIPLGASGPYFVRTSRDMAALTIDGPKEGIYKVLIITNQK